MANRDEQQFSDEQLMREAIKLAKLGRGWVNPNPLVGCVIVDSKGEIIGKGYHHKFGMPHAEREALADCAAGGTSTQGATAYVTLEPCAHTGKTPPCTDALIEAGIAKVVVGSADPNPLVAGKGIQRLRDADIEVVEGVAKDLCDDINRAFFHWVQTKRPFAIAKYAMTLDGKIATHIGESRWITGEAAREKVHQDRATYSAIMVGVGTVLADNPHLTARPSELRDTNIHQPIRIVCDTSLRTPLESNLVQSAYENPVIIATSETNSHRYAPYIDAGCKIVVVDKDTSGHIDLSKLMDELGAQNIDSVIVEGGSTLLGAMFDLGLIDRVQAYIAPKIFGGKDAPSPIAGIGKEHPNEAIRLKCFNTFELGGDILIEGDVAK